MQIKPRILVVNDNEKLRASIKEVLEENGYTFEYVNNGKDAIALSQNNRYDIAIVDIKLPDIPGTEATREIEKASPTTEFIYITGHASLGSAIEVEKEKHVISCETKPLDMNRILLIIKQILKRKQEDEEAREDEERYRQIMQL